MQLTHSIRKSLLVLLLAGLAGCTGNAGEAAPALPGPPGPAGAAGTIGTGGAGGGLVVSTCAPGIPVSSQIPRLTRVQYATVINELLGVTPGADVMDLIANDSTGSLTDVSWNGYLTAAEKIATQVLGNATSKAKFITCDAAAATCLSDTIKAFGRKAYRRPLTDAEVTSFMRFNSLPQTHTPADVTEAILDAFLASPTFIMVPELAETPEGSAFKLNHFEVAAKLSLLLWNWPPGRRRSPLRRTATSSVRRTRLRCRRNACSPTPRRRASRRPSTTFYADVQTGSHWVNVSEHDTTKFPSFKPGSYNAAMQELDAFFAEMVKGGGTFKDLFLSTTAFVTQDTAGIYGLNAASYGTTPTKVALDATKRPGFLTRVAFLSTFSHFDATSPILRGAFITGRVLDVPTGTPNPAFLNMKPPAANYKTNREATEALTAPATCAACHAQKVNPPGFVLERYDAVGGWQDTDPLGGPINSTADITFDGTKFQTISAPADLMTGIAASPNAQRFYAGMWVNFAAGRPSTLNDACVVDQLATNLAATPTYSIASMMADFAKSDSFRLRTVGN